MSPEGVILYFTKKFLIFLLTDAFHGRKKREEFL